MKKILILIISIVTISSCSHSNDSLIQDNILNGTWNLKKVYGGFAATSNYEIGDVKWTFDVIENKVIILNNIMTSTEPISGTYEYRIDQNGEIKTLFINSIERGNIIMLSKKKLKLDLDSAADGFFTELEK
jgi:hypothetical protein